MEEKNGVSIFYAKNRTVWRKWLMKNHKKEEKIFLQIFHIKSKTSSIKYAEAVEEALCFGWIDSVKYKFDTESSIQYFSKRKVKSNWSESNRIRVNELMAKGKMYPEGIKMVEIAKTNGTWEALIPIQQLVIPEDFQKLLNKNKNAYINFTAFSASSKKMMLEWLLVAKRPETRVQRMNEIICQAEKNIKANQYKTIKNDSICKI